MTSGNYKTSYQADMAIFQTIWIKCWMAGWIVLMFIFPFWAGPYLTYVVNLAAIATIGAIGMNLLTGFTGQISLGHGAFIAIGAYSAAILGADAGWPFWLSLPAAGLITAISGLIVAIPSLRLRGLYLVMTTLAFTFIIQYVIIKWESLTRGSTGMGVPTPTIFGYAIDNDRAFYFLVMPIVAVSLLYARNLIRTKVGRAWVAIRDRDISAEIMGVNLAKYKIMAFFISSFYAGVAGGLYGYYITDISPEHFPLTLSIDYLAMIIIGGMGSILGSVFGAMFITMLPEGIRIAADVFGTAYPVLVDRFFEVKVMAFGVAIILFLMFEPTGIYGRWVKTKIYYKLWPFTY
ncbi:MAG: branched-chain amino acid ABC transporter permease [Thermodesulfobacteriota bacterium]|nr:branched-chain amino acid ABC transporter permease [Thermodesulfobacteriota bacterium]